MSDETAENKAYGTGWLRCRACLITGPGVDATTNGNLHSDAVLCHNLRIGNPTGPIWNEGKDRVITTLDASEESLIVAAVVDFRERTLTEEEPDNE